MIFKNPICLMKSLIRSLKCCRLVSGHEFKTSLEETPANIHILICQNCGHESIAWDWDGSTIHK